MAERLNPDEDQQEERAMRAKALAERIGTAATDGKFGGEVTFKGETVDVKTVSGRIAITANSDGSFSIADGPSHISAEDVMQQLTGQARG